MEGLRGIQPLRAFRVIRRHSVGGGGSANAHANRGPGSGVAFQAANRGRRISVAMGGILPTVRTERAGTWTSGGAQQGPTAFQIQISTEYGESVKIEDRGRLWN